MPSGRQLRTLKGHKAKVLSADFSRDGRHVVTGSNDKTAKVWDVATGETVWDIEGAVPILSTPYLPDGNRLALGTAENVTIYDVQTQKLLHTFGKDDLGNSAEEEARQSLPGRTEIAWRSAAETMCGCSTSARMA